MKVGVDFVSETTKYQIVTKATQAMTYPKKSAEFPGSSSQTLANFRDQERSYFVRGQCETYTSICTTQVEIST